MYLLCFVVAAFLFGNGQAELLDVPLSLVPQDLVMELVTLGVPIPNPPTMENILLALYGAGRLSQTDLGCIVGFATMGFNFNEFARYPEFFSDESNMTLAQAGSYVGPEDIEEYVRFAYPNVYIVSNDAQQDIRTYLGWEGAAPACQFLRFAESLYLFRKPAFETEFTLLGMQKIYYMLQTNKLGRMLIYYGADSLEYFFGTLLNTHEYREFICETMYENCLGMWRLNGYLSFEQAQSMEQCISDLTELPIAEGDHTDITGKSLGCRMLHTIFARVNDAHCPHISLRPFEDVNGKIKCQESKNIQPTDLFSSEELALFSKFAEDTGAPAGTTLIMPRIECEVADDCPIGFTCNLNSEPHGICTRVEENDEEESPSSSSAIWATSSLMLWIGSLLFRAFN